MFKEIVPLDVDKKFHIPYLTPPTKEVIFLFCFIKINNAYINVSSSEISMGQQALFFRE
jgi:hypothetical protein